MSEERSPWQAGSRALVVLAYYFIELVKASSAYGMTQNFTNQIISRQIEAVSGSGCSQGFCYPRLLPKLSRTSKL